MSRWVIALIFMAAGSLNAQTAPPPPTTPPDQKAPELKRDRDRTQKTSDKEEVPPEEDTSLTRDDYSFNPMQSQRDVAAGDYYRKKGNYPAAARRYQTATFRNDGNTEAWLKLGEARQKMRDDKGAKEAYNKYLELDPNSKTAQEVRKSLAKLK
jgi:tetratricopeptide (TPR) repeat protein